MLRQLIKSRDVLRILLHIGAENTRNRRFDDVKLRVVISIYIPLKKDKVKDFISRLKNKDKLIDCLCFFKEQTKFFTLFFFKGIEMEMTPHVPR